MVLAVASSTLEIGSDAFLLKEDKKTLRCGEDGESARVNKVNGSTEMITTLYQYEKADLKSGVFRETIICYMQYRLIFGSSLETSISLLKV